MAQDFEKAVGLNVGTGATTILTSNSDDAIIGIRLANILGSTIQVDVYITHNDGGGDDNYYLVRYQYSTKFIRRTCRRRF